MFGDTTVPARMLTNGITTLLITTGVTLTTVDIATNHLVTLGTTTVGQAGIILVGVGNPSRAENNLGINRQGGSNL